jgi:hypothetical protein
MLCSRTTYFTLLVTCIVSLALLTFDAYVSHQNRKLCTYLVVSRAATGRARSGAQSARTTCWAAPACPPAPPAIIPPSPAPPVPAAGGAPADRASAGSAVLRARQEILHFLNSVLQRKLGRGSCSCCLNHCHGSTFHYCHDSVIP